MSKKQYKSKGGLTRHSSAKHKEEETTSAVNAETVEDISLASLTDVVRKAVTTASRNKCFPLNVTQEIQSFPVMLTEESALYKDIQGLYRKLQKRGDAEEFYAAFYAKIVLYSNDYFTTLTSHASTFLASKVADGILIYYKKSLKCDIPSDSKQMRLCQEEKDGLGYLGGYVFTTFLESLKIQKTMQQKKARIVCKF